MMNYTEKRKTLIMLISSLLITAITFGQNDSTADKWQNSGAHIITSADFVGNVGIGTASPNRKLTVSSAGGVVGRFESSHVNGTLLDLKSLAGKDAALRFQGGLNWTIGNDNSLNNSFMIGKFNAFPLGTNNNKKYLVINSDGYIGIGSTDPVDKLHVLDPTYPAIRLSDGAGNQGQLALATNPGYYSPFTQTGDIVLRSLNGSLVINTFGPNGAIRFGTGNGPNTEKMTITNTGSVGIGITTVPNGYLLAVDGKAICEELKVESSVSWPDYVFASDYPLLPLNKLASYIDQNKHLPGIPSGEEVKENGIEVGKMNAKLLQKIEELTLYTIEQQKLIEKLTKRIEALENN